MRSARILAVAAFATWLAVAACVPANSIIRFNEIQDHPAGDEAGLEWGELFNSQSFDMDISGWRLDDGVAFCDHG